VLVVIKNNQPQFPHSTKAFFDDTSGKIKWKTDQKIWKHLSIINENIITITLLSMQYWCRWTKLHWYWNAWQKKKKAINLQTGLMVYLELWFYHMLKKINHLTEYSDSIHSN